MVSSPLEAADTSHSRSAKTEGCGEDILNEEDGDALHCLCRLPADTARFRTLMKCDLCHGWFHPACVRLKVELDACKKKV